MTEEKKHAILSPSAASRWMSCTPSARLEGEIPASTSDAAEEGTVAHALAELLLRKYFNQIGAEEYDRKFREIIDSKYYDLDMLRHAENYRDFVIELYNDATLRSPDAMVMLEQRLDLTEYIPEGFGTADANIVADRVLDMVDLKYGKGVKVDVVENKQMMIYGLGSYLKFSVMYDIEVVRMTIYQPRIDNIVTWELSVRELLEWAEKELKPKARLAWEGAGEFHPGKHCQFCAVKPRCRALADYNLAIARNEFKQAELLTQEEVAEVLEKLETLTSWAKAVNDYALSEALKGTKWPGFKLVEGRSVRRITDEEAVKAVLMSNGFQEDEFTHKKLKGITDLEKLVGKKPFRDLLGDYVEKPAGAPTLVPLTDKRPEYMSAKADFTNVNFAELV